MAIQVSSSNCLDAGTLLQAGRKPEPGGACALSEARKCPWGIRHAK